MRPGTSGWDVLGHAASVNIAIEAAVFVGRDLIQVRY
jgi:hypothetical protein